MDGIEVVDIAHAIELALAPVFLLSGIGIVLTVIAGLLIWHESLDWLRAGGILLILAGIAAVNLSPNVAAP
jgi:multidrug transporter EmrE-like cation transporter